MDGEIADQVQNLRSSVTGSAQEMSALDVLYTRASQMKVGSGFQRS